MDFLLWMLGHRITNFFFLVLSLGGLFYVVVYVDPEVNVFAYSSLLFLLLGAFCSVFFLFYLIFRNAVVGLLGGLFVVSNIALRYFGFKDILYSLILLLVVVLLGLLFRRSRRDVRRQQVKKER